MASAPDLPRLRRLLLGLIAPASARALDHLHALNDVELGALDAMAGEHRLRPLLHHLHGASALPATIAESWREAHRHARLSAMAHAAELRAVCGLLGGAGMAPVALKGAWLAWHVYPDPALRPLRDLDLLLPDGQVIAAFELLLANGYRQRSAADLSPADALRLEKHLPPLMSPRDVAIELHHRLWEVDGRMDHVAPAAMTGTPLDRAITIDGLRYLAPQDSLAHLIIHAVYDHRLDCGPLLLWDIACLLRAAPIDWNTFWQAAAEGGWAKGARLVLDLVQRHDASVPIVFPDGPFSTPAAILDAAPDLLLQPLETRQSAGVVATARAAGPLRLLRRLAARRGAEGEVQTVARDLSAEGGYSGWAANRLKRTLGQLADATTRRQAGDLARLSRWLDD